ncbi:hypothetical protein BT93_E2510 [Corymbia citriodora subsp. variegata]|nr:hypothetical protein BT93_E2510 [Corymbia citriodora subsp. variegata]
MVPPALLLLLLPMFASTISAQYFPKPYCGSTGNFTANSTYQTTLTTLLSSISTTNASSLSYDFFNASAAVSDASQTLYVFGLCRGDFIVVDCHACLDNAASDIQRLCPLQKEAILYAENCIILYSNASFFGTVTTEPLLELTFSDKVSSPETYDAAMRKLLYGLLAKAAGGSSLRKYASGNESAGPDRIYALVQCMPDLKEQQCSDCLVRGIQSIRSHDTYSRGWFMVPSCLIWYDTNHWFFDPASEPPASEPLPLPPPPVGKSNSTGTLIIVVTSVSSILVMGVVIVLLKAKRKKKQSRKKVEGEVVHEISMAESLKFDFGIIKAATDNFSDSKKLGQGGFGAVYRNMIPSKHVDPLKHANLNWDKRHKIIMGVARGMLYLHEDSGLCIIHRDLKASNILLDSDMNPKISDFGTARLFELDQTQAETNRIVGTYGYMAPEYVMNGNFSIKSNVFSFGVLVLEIVSGLRNNHCMGNNMEVLISYVWKNWSEGSISNIIDPSIILGLSTEIERCIHIGLLCVQENAASRPTMASVLFMLNSCSVNLQFPSRPAFFMHSTIKFDMPSRQNYNSRAFEVERSRDKSNQFSINESSMTEPYPR